MNKDLLEYANSSMPMSREEQNTIIENATLAYEKFMDALRIDWRNDPNSSDTPNRVAKSFVNDLIKGCYNTPPKVTAFDNLQKYDGIVFSGKIDVKSICSHHHLSFFGNAYVAYIPDENGKVIGLSKLNRVVEWFAKRPQVQENLTMQIHDYLDGVCIGNQGVAVMIKCKHLCTCMRGVQHDSYMITSKLSKNFEKNILTRNEFYNFIN